MLKSSRLCIKLQIVVLLLFFMSRKAFSLTDERISLGFCEADILLPLVVSICYKNSISYKKTLGRYLSYLSEFGLSWFS